jgi:hypothetical protein
VRLVVLALLVGCSSTHPSVRSIPPNAAEDGACPTGADAEFRLRNGRGGDSIVTIDGGPRLHRMITCTYDVMYREAGCPAATQLSISRDDLAVCPAPSAIGPALIEAHGLASSPCASIAPQKLAATTHEDACIYAVTEREIRGSSSGFTWVVLH